MLNELQIQNLRGIKNIHLTDLCQVNVFLGGNNQGKTTILEALYLLTAPEPQKLTLLPYVFRGIGQPMIQNNQIFNNPKIDFQDYWLWCFPQQDINQQPTITARQINDARTVLQCKLQLSQTRPNQKPSTDSQLLPAESRHLHVSYWRNDSLQRYFCKQPPEQQIAFNECSINKPQTEPRNKIKNSSNVLPLQFTWLTSAAVASHEIKSERTALIVDKMIGRNPDNLAQLIQLLRIVDPRTKNLRFSSISGKPTIMVWFDGNTTEVPFTQAGQAFVRLLDIFSQLYLSNEQIWLVDELENGIHHTALPDVWRGLASLVNNTNKQLFITTHSAECLTAAIQAFEHQRDAIAFFLLDNALPNHFSHFAHSEALFALNNNIELRGVR